MASRAIIFPGQGAQAVGMGHEFFKTCAECEELFERANEVLSTDLAELCFKGPIESLTVSSNAQPAIFLVSVAAYTYLKREVPSLMMPALLTRMSILPKSLCTWSATCCTWSASRTSTA